MGTAETWQPHIPPLQGREAPVGADRLGDGVSTALSLDTSLLLELGRARVTPSAGPGVDKLWSVGQVWPTVCVNKPLLEPAPPPHLCPGSFVVRGGDATAATA